MGWCFYKGFNLGKLLRLNLSGSGLGVSTGIRGLRVGLGPRGGRLQVTIPGTGIYYRKGFSLRKKLKRDGHGPDRSLWGAES